MACQSYPKEMLDIPVGVILQENVIHSFHLPFHFHLTGRPLYTAGSKTMTTDWETSVTRVEQEGEPQIGRT